MSILVRPFDSPEAFEEGKVLRIPPEKLQELGIYTLRIMSPPGESPFATEMPALIDSVESHERPDFFTVRTFCKPREDRPGMWLPFLTRSLGYIVMSFDGGPEIDAGYFLGAEQVNATVETTVARLLQEPATLAAPSSVSQTPGG